VKLIDKKILFTYNYLNSSKKKNYYKQLNSNFIEKKNLQQINTNNIINNDKIFILLKINNNLILNKLRFNKYNKLYKNSKKNIIIKFIFIKTNLTKNINFIINKLILTINLKKNI